jgi:L-iditol 2-dehydrogenase
MRAAVLYGIHDMRFEDRLEPILAPGQVIVRIGAVGICGSDVHYFAHGRIGPYVVNSPLVLGHECAGTVTEAGPGVTSVSVGDRVVVEPQRTCGLCSECTSGRYNLCRSVEFFATPPYDGALQEFMAVPERIVHRLPATMSMEQGALIEPLSVALAACDVIDVAPGDRVLVTGAGPIGVLVSRVALAAGAAEVAVCDVEPSRLEFVGRQARTRTVLSGEGALVSVIGDDWDGFVECSGSGMALNEGIACVRPAGRIALVGMFLNDQVTIAPTQLQAKELSMKGVFRYANQFPRAIRLLESNVLEVMDLVTGRWSFEDVAKAFERADSDRIHVLKEMVTL